MIVILGQFDFHPDDAPRAAELMRVMADETVKEDGCLHYAFSRDVGAANRFQLGEWWRDDAALAAHFASAHMAAYRAGVALLRIQKRMVKKFEVAGVGDL